MESGVKNLQCCHLYYFTIENECSILIVFLD